METTSRAIIADMLRKHVVSAGSRSAEECFEAIVSRFPEETLSAVLGRVLVGVKLEVNLYTDIFNINDFSYDMYRQPTRQSLRALNGITLVSDLIVHVPWFGWDAVRSTLTDALDALPEDQVRLSEMDAHRLRSAVLVNCVVDKSNDKESYSNTVGFFENNYDAIYACLPALIERHRELSEVDLDLVEDIMSGIPLAMVRGTL